VARKGLGRGGERVSEMEREGKRGRGEKGREGREREGGRGVRLPLSKFLDPPLRSRRLESDCGPVLGVQVFSAGV